MYQEVLAFWFQEIEPSQWWKKDIDFDRSVQNRFGAVHRQATKGELFSWRSIAQGSLAEIIVLDQFSRNIFRNQPAAFASDPVALVLAQTAISQGFDMELSPVERRFIYLPFMHSESPLIHQEAVKLYESLGSANDLEFELKHKAIIDRFGRYPHRNQILGRESTAEEIEFLKQPNSAF